MDSQRLTQLWEEDWKDAYQDGTTTGELNWSLTKQTCENLSQSTKSKAWYSKWQIADQPDEAN